MLPPDDWNRGFGRVATWAEGLALSAAAAARRRADAFDPEWWSSLYDDLADIFGSEDAGPLRGRQLLVDDNFAIHRTWGSAKADDGPAIFFPMREIPDGVLIAGTNLPMLLDFVLSSNANTGEAAKTAAERGRTSVSVHLGTPS